MYVENALINFVMLRLAGRNPSFKWEPPLTTKPAETVQKKTIPSWCNMPFNDVMRGWVGFCPRFIRIMRILYNAYTMRQELIKEVSLD